MRILKIFILCLIIVSFVFANHGWAEDFSSNNFTSEDPIISDFGGTSSSSNFKNESAGGQVAPGESTSSNFILQAGLLFKKDFVPKSQNWQWFDDEENETPSIVLASENIAPTGVSDNSVVKLRLTIKETGGKNSQDQKFRLQFSKSSDFTGLVFDIQEIASCSFNPVGWCYADGVDSDGDIITTGLLSDSDSCVGSSGDGCGTHNESGISPSSFKHKKSDAVEYEFTIRNYYADLNTTYFFRAYDVNNNKAVELNTGESYPSLVTSGVEFTFQVNGISSGTITEGITTDVSTTATTIPFGSLSFDAEVEAAQEFIISTNASNGYQIFAFQRQGLRSNQFDEILGVAGTNTSPVAWSVGCTASATGCYGYHSGDDSLINASSRFAPDDTYAAFGGVAEEVVFSPSAVASESNNLIFKIRVDNQQEAGDYESQVVYIAVPTF